MPDTLAETLAARIRKSAAPALQAAVNDHREDDSQQALLVAERLAKAVRFSPLMTGPMPGDDGCLFFLPDDLIVTSLHAETEELLDRAGFNVTHVRSQEAADRVSEALAAAEGEGWLLRNCVDKTWNKDTGAVLSVDDDDGRPLGMIAYRREVSIDVEDDDRFVLHYAVRPELVYVLPDERGNLLSSALRRAVMEDVIGEVEDISALWRSGKLQKTAPLLLQFEVSATVMSPEGERFVDALKINLEEQVERCFTKEEIESDFVHSTAVEPAY